MSNSSTDTYRSLIEVVITKILMIMVNTYLEIANHNINIDDMKSNQFYKSVKRRNKTKNQINHKKFVWILRKIETMFANNFRVKNQK